MARRTHEFQTIHSEGGLLPPDLLRRVLDPKEKLEGTTPTDYGLPPGERLNEVITQSWNRLRKHWADFRAAAKGLPEDEAGTGLTNDKWSVPLLRELGFGMLPTSTAPEINGKTYAINRFFGATAVHLIGCQLDLDRRAKGVRGAAIANPHGLVQDFLNRSDKHLWAILSNGLRLRILRDSQAISRQSYLEFDLEAMFEGQVFADFVLLWLLAHSTRFAARESDRPETCWLEQWTKEAEEQGTRALGDLRQGVEKALEVLGQGFVSHPKNTALRDALRSGKLSLTEFHGQLLRVVYRLIFLFVAEDRTLDGLPLLHVPDDLEATRIAREWYAAHYSAGRLRDMAGSIRGSRHGDLWWQLNLVVGALSGDARFKAAREQLALPALGSFLWSPDSTAALNAPSIVQSDGTALSNADLLEAIRHLAFTRQNHALRPVDYKNLGAEELGGVYESLLALTPQISGDGAKFTFAEFAGNERKTSGSYYTPDSLVQCLLDSALEPVIEEAVKGKNGADAEQAILSLKVCDPAVGSGHFLVGAAHRLARHLARIRAVAEGEGEPSPKFYQHALRDVIGRCLYGVDINPMAAELCRVSLWLEALEPGKPLSFLDHHIRVGNSLLGTAPALIAGGLPDDAFTAIEGDDKKVCTQLKKRNKAEREGFDQRDWLGGAEHGVTADLSAVTRQASELDTTADDTVDAVQRKADQFRRLVVSPEYKHAQQVADAWCAAFVWPKTPATVNEVVTTSVIQRLGKDPMALSAAQTRKVESLSGQYQFFHWHLAFPEVSAKGGFDCVLGNPPWVRQELFRPIKNLLAIYGAFNSTADLSVFFVELSTRCLNPCGRAALLTPNKWFRAAYGEELRRYLASKARIHLVIDFGHSKNLFENIDTFPACIVLGRQVNTVSADLPLAFVRAYDGDRLTLSLKELVESKSIDVSHGCLDVNGWVFNDRRVEEIIQAMRARGVPLRDYVGCSPLYGIKTGLNEAYYLDDAQAQLLLAAQEDAKELVRPFVRGRDVSRWAVGWERQWHIVIASSQNQAWPWSKATSEADAERIFEATYPAVHAHLKHYEIGLRARSDQGVYWWELRSCDYYARLREAKIVVPRIAFHSACGVDSVGYFQNDSTVFIPTDDLFLLAVLNSQIAWWYMTLTFPHKKDEALSMDADYLERFPVPKVNEELKMEIRALCERLVALAKGDGQGAEERVALESRASLLVLEAYGLPDNASAVLQANPVLRDPLDVVARAAMREARSVGSTK